MQSLPIFIFELQTAKRELLKTFELPDDSRPHQNATQRRRVVRNLLIVIGDEPIAPDLTGPPADL